MEQEIPIKILRKQVTRSEILGILGTLDRESNFSIAYTGEKAFFDNMVAVQSGWRARKIHIYIQEGDKFNYALWYIQNSALFLNISHHILSAYSFAELWAMR